MPLFERSLLSGLFIIYAGLLSTRIHGSPERALYGFGAGDRLRRL